MESYLRKRGVRLALLIGLVVASVAAIYFLSDVFAPLILGFLIAYVLDPLADTLQKARLGPLRFNRTGAVVVIFGFGALLLMAVLTTGGYYVKVGIDRVYSDMIGERHYESRSVAAGIIVENSTPISEVRPPLFLVDLNGNGQADPDEETFPGWRNAYIAARKHEAPVVKLPESGATRFYIDTDHNGRYTPGYVPRLSEWVTRLEYRYHLTEAVSKSLQDWTGANGALEPAKLKAKFEAWFEAFKKFKTKHDDKKDDDKKDDDHGPGLLGIVSYLVFCPLYAFFFLLEIDPMIAGIRRHLPGRHRPRIERIFSQVDRTISSFLRGRLIICLIKSTLTAIGLGALGVDYAIPLGLTAGFLSLVPYVGIYFSMVPALILCWLEYASFGRVLGALSVYVVIEWLEGIVLVPQILGKEIGLHPLTVIVTLLLFGKLLGFIGLLLSVPLAAICKILGMEFLMPLIDEFAAEEPVPEAEPPNSGEAGG